MSETLRWILIAFSVVLLVGIYLWGRRGGQTASDDAALRMRPEPRMPASESHEAFVESAAQSDADSTPYGAEADRWAITATRPARDHDPALAEETQPGFATQEPPQRELPGRRARVEPTFSDVTAELPTHDVIEPVAQEDMQESRAAMVADSDASAPAGTEQAPTLSMSSTPQPRRIERRKIIALRLAAGPQRFDGAKLRAALESESLQHGKYHVFHRLHAQDVSIFSIASMVEPGTFDHGKMAETQYPGITLFAQLPGPVPGMHALNELVACARRLHQTLGGTLQDDRGVPLTVHRIERLRQEVREFERPAAAAGSASQPTGH